MVVELADTSDSKSDERKLVRVQVPPAAPCYLCKLSSIQIDMDHTRSMEDRVYDLMEAIKHYDFSNLLWLLIIILLALWLLIGLWAWGDISERTNNKYAKVLTITVVLLLPIVGLILYLLARPRTTILERFWIDLERRHLLYETEELGDCPRCGTQLSIGYNYCLACGEPTKLTCTACSAQIPKHSLFCPYCGKAVEMGVEEFVESISDQDLAAMEEQIQRTDEEAYMRASYENPVSSSASNDVFTRLGNYVLGGVKTIFLPWMSLYMKIGDSISNTFSQAWDAGKTAAQQVDSDQQPESSEDMVFPDTKTRNKKRNKSKKRKSKRKNKK